MYPAADPEKLFTSLRSALPITSAKLSDMRLSDGLTENAGPENGGPKKIKDLN